MGIPVNQQRVLNTDQFSTVISIATRYKQLYGLSILSLGLVQYLKLVFVAITVIPMFSMVL